RIHSDFAFDNSNRGAVRLPINIELRANRPNPRTSRTDNEWPRAVMGDAKQRLPLHQLHVTLACLEAHPNSGSRVELDHRTIVESDRPLFTDGSRIAAAHDVVVRAAKPYPHEYECGSNSQRPLATPPNPLRSSTLSSRLPPRAQSQQLNILRLRPGFC